MIIVTVMQTDHGRWTTTVTDMDGTPVRNPHAGTSLDMVHHSSELAWSRVGWVVQNVADRAAVVHAVDARPRHSAIDAVVRGHREN